MYITQKVSGSQELIEDIFIWQSYNITSSIHSSIQVQPEKPGANLS